MATISKESSRRENYSMGISSEIVTKNTDV
jgi:hypothetical protein